MDDLSVLVDPSLIRQKIGEVGCQLFWTEAQIVESRLDRVKRFAALVAA